MESINIHDQDSSNQSQTQSNVQKLKQFVTSTIFQSKTFYEQHSSFFQKLFSIYFFSMLLFEYVELSMHVYFIALSYMTTIEYYTLKLNKQMKQNKQNKQNGQDDHVQSLIIGWTLFSGIVVLDYILNASIFLFGIWFGVLFRMLRVMMYMSYTSNFVEFLKLRELQLKQTRETFKNMEQDDIPELNNLFDKLFFNLLVLNDKMLYFACIEFIIKLLDYVAKSSSVIVNYVLFAYDKVKELNVTTLSSRINFSSFTKKFN